MIDDRWPLRGRTSTLWLAQLDDPASQQTQIWNREHDQIVMRQLLELVKPQFESTTWKAFCRVALDGQKAQAVADELQISRNSVFLAKSRVLRRLRQESEGLVAASTSFSGGADRLFSLRFFVGGGGCRPPESSSRKRGD